MDRLQGTAASSSPSGESSGDASKQHRATLADAQPRKEHRKGSRPAEEVGCQSTDRVPHMPVRYSFVLSFLFCVFLSGNCFRRTKQPLTKQKQGSPHQVRRGKARVPAMPQERPRVPWLHRRGRRAGAETLVSARCQDCARRCQRVRKGPCDVWSRRGRPEAASPPARGGAPRLGLYRVVSLL